MPREGGAGWSRKEREGHERRKRGRESTSLPDRERRDDDEVFLLRLDLHLRLRMRNAGLERPSFVLCVHLQQQERRPDRSLTRRTTRAALLHTLPLASLLNLCAGRGETFVARRRGSGGKVGERAERGRGSRRERVRVVV